MSKIKKALYYLLHNRRMLRYAILKRLGCFYSDEQYIKKIFQLHMGYALDLKNPVTFSEKIQWLKLNDRNPLYPQMIDKYEAKIYVSKLIGEEYIIPTLGVWDCVEDIDFDALPRQFVLKTTHGGSNEGVVICQDKSKLDIESCKKRLDKAMKQNLYYHLREWGYKNLPRRIIAEQYMEDSNSDELIDYKFYCFNGIAKYCQVIGNRKTQETIDFYDEDWIHQEFYGLLPQIEVYGQVSIKQSQSPINRPHNYALMLDIAQKLSADIPFLRVDLYEINGKVYFGELTFYPASGLGLFEPSRWNEQLGAMIELPR